VACVRRTGRVISPALFSLSFSLCSSFSSLFLRLLLLLLSLTALLFFFFFPISYAGARNAFN